MIEQMFETFHKTSKSALQIQQEVLKQWARQWPWLPTPEEGVSAEWLQAFQKRWIESSSASLERNRAALDSMYRSGLELIDQSLQLSDGKSPEQVRRLMEGLWRQTIDACRDQTEAQLRDFQKAVETCAELCPSA